MATISTLAVNLIARTGVFERKMKKSRRAMGFFAKQAQFARRAMLRFGAGMLAVAGVGGLGLMISRTMKAIDVTAKLAAALQISTEALKGLELAATISGTSFETVTKSLEIMVRRLAESKLGIGEAKRGLDAMKLSAQELINVGTEEAFMRIAEQLSKIPAVADRAFAAYTIFGRQGAKLMNLVKDGRKGLEAFRKEAEKLGITFGAVDAAKIEEANDAIARARLSIQGIIQDITIELAPLITTVGNSFAGWVSSSEGLRENIIGIIQPIVVGMAYLKDFFDFIFGGLQTIVGTVQGALGIIVTGIGQIVSVISKTIGGMIQEVGDVLQEAGSKNIERGIQKLMSGITGSAAEATAEFFHQQELAAGRLAIELEAAAIQRASDARAMAQQQAEAAALAKVFETGTRIAEQMATPLEKYNSRLSELQSLLEANAITMETFNRAAEKATETLTGKLFDLTPMEEYEKQITKLNDLIGAGAINWEMYGRATREARAKLESFAAKEQDISAFAGPGGARIIREAFVSVSGLALGTKDPTLSRMDQQLAVTQKTNLILEQIRNEGGLS